MGKLLTGNLIEFDSGLTAIETKLGWKVIGKVCSNDKNVMLTTSSLHVRNVSVKELWELDVLGITDPLLNENTKENFELTDFKNKMKILPDGRYEVKLPWKCNSENLPSNKELTWKRHLRMMNKLRNVYLQVDDHVHPGNSPAAVSSKKKDLLHMEFYHHLPSWAMNEQMSYFSSFSDEWSRDLKTTKEIPVVFKYRNSVHVEVAIAIYISLRRHVSGMLKTPSLGLFRCLSSPLRCQIFCLTSAPNLGPLWCLSSSELHHAPPVQAFAVRLAETFR
ncbi:DUF1758 domain-containing protein [Trichonephila clavipes]|nr:DUF1758 domain-containing protein [Trichonephila clavipes]